MRKSFIIISVVTVLLILLWSYFWINACFCFSWWGLLYTWGSRTSYKHNNQYDVTFRYWVDLRYVFEDFRPKIQQYFVESDTDGAPINRNDRSVIYQRAKKQIDTTPFGTQLNVYAEGYEWMGHSIVPRDFHSINHHPRVLIGNKDCKQPYEASILNISAMSFGSLSGNAVEALNSGRQDRGICPEHRRRRFKSSSSQVWRRYHLANRHRLFWGEG